MFLEHSTYIFFAIYFFINLEKKTDKIYLFKNLHKKLYKIII